MLVQIYLVTISLISLFIRTDFMKRFAGFFLKQRRFVVEARQMVFDW